MLKVNDGRFGWCLGTDPDQHRKCRKSMVVHGALIWCRCTTCNHAHRGDRP